jgi:Immunity protein 35
MITVEEARHIAETGIDNNRTIPEDSPVIVDEHTIETAYAWVFFFTSKQFQETGDMSFALAGNSPLFISKDDGQITRYPTFLGIDEMISQYEEENKIWQLVLIDIIVSDARKMLILKKEIGLSMAKISVYKNEENPVLDIGAKGRLILIQKQLSLAGIQTILTQKI